MSEQTTNIAKTLATIDADLDAAGWDKPGQLYQLIDDEQDPTAQLIGVLPTYPPTDLIAGYDAGSRCPDFVHGLTVSHEGYRHLTFEELIERNPTMIEEIKKAAVRDGLVILDKLSEDELREIIRNYYRNVMFEKLPSPGQFPDSMRQEVRITVAVMRDGTVHRLIRTRGEKQAEHFVGEVDGTERIPDVLYMFLHGVRPDPECKDPKTVVEDYKTLEALAALPVAEER